MAGKNLWGALPEIENIRTPHEMLLEQGECLADMTNGLLSLNIERVRKKVFFTYDVSIQISDLEFCQTLLKVTHDIKLYPAKLDFELTDEEYTSNSQEEFEEDLGTILSSNELGGLIRSLMAQAKLERELAMEGEQSC